MKISTTTFKILRDYLAPKIKLYVFEIEESITTGSATVSVCDMEKESWIDEPEQSNDAVWD